MQPHRRKKKQEQSKELSSAKRRLFSVITLGIPIIAFVFLEVGLRLFDYGPDLSLFKMEEFGGKSYLIMNPDVKNRYFSRFQFNPNSSPDLFPVPKPKGTFRIFCLGGSTTVGYPYWYVGSFSTFLRDRLRRVFPDRKLEVVNLGLTATNSYTALDMARELVDYEPDLFLVYDGHNEFYGALGVASNESVGQFRWVTGAYLKLVHLRTFVVLRNIIRKGLDLFKSGTEPEPTGTMMERLSRGQYVPYGSKTYYDAMDIFKANMEDLAALSSKHHIPVLFASQVSNLRHQPPFISVDDESKSPIARQEFRETFERGIKRWEEGQWDSAFSDFQRCVLLDPFRADAHYSLGMYFDTLGRKQEARMEYEKARDYDQLRFRTSTDFNNAIRQIENGTTVFFVDMERKFRENSPDSVIGKELILEHLHPTARGYFLMAKEFAAAMHTFNILASKEGWDRRDTLKDDHLWEERAMTELDELCAKRRTEYLTSGWPFRSRTVPVNRINENDPIERIVEQVVRADLTWEQGHVAAAELYEARGDYAGAEKEYKAVINQIPLNVSPYLRLGQVYLRWRKYPEARTVFLMSVEVERTAYAYKVLGSLAAESGVMSEAVSHFENAFALSEGVSARSEVGYMLALACSRAGMPARAMQVLQHVLTVNPQYEPARKLLQRINRPSP